MNIFVHPPTAHSYVKAPVPYLEVSLWEVIRIRLGYEGRALMMGFMAL